MTPPSRISRRQSLTTAGLAAAGFLLHEAAAATTAPSTNPAAQVADRGSSIRITRLDAMVAGAKAYIKISTSHNVVGWGEITGLDPSVACALARSLYELLDDENPTRIEHLWQKIYRSHRDMRGGPFMVDTLSAIDMALWDITGKLYGVPVYRLLGGPVRDKIRLYPTAKAIKVGTGGPHPFSADPSDITGLVRMVEDGPQKSRPLRQRDVRCPLRPPASHAHSICQRHQAV